MNGWTAPAITGVGGPARPPPARLLAAADAYHAMTEPRPHRAALPAEAAAEGPGRGAGGPPRRRRGGGGARRRRPAGRRGSAPGGSDRARGGGDPPARARAQTKQIATALGISVKTADHHVQHAYAKIGVSTRAAATLFAMQHGLMAWENSRFRDRPST